MFGGTEEIIEDGETGFLIDEYDGEMLNKCIEKILDKPELSVSMGLKGRQKVKEEFESSKQYDKMRDLLQSWI